MTGFNKRINQMSPAEQKKYREQFKNDIGLGVQYNYNEKAFDAVLSARRTDHSKFFESEKPSDAEKKYKEAIDSSIILKAALKRALDVTAPNHPMSEAQQKFNQSVSDLKGYIEEIPQRHSPAAFIATMNAYKQEGIEAIQKQHKAEIELLKAELQKPEVNAELRDKLGIKVEPEKPKDGSELPAQVGINAAPAAPKDGNELPAKVGIAEGKISDSDKAKLEDAKKAIIADLEKDQAKQLKQFTDDNNKPLKTLFEESQKRTREIAFLAYLKNNNEAMAKEIEDLHRAHLDKANPPGEAEIIVNKKADRTEVQFSGVSLSKLEIIKTVTGRDIENKDGAFTMKFGMHLTHAKYYLDPRHNVTSDFCTMAQAVRASGHDSIKMNLNFDPQKLAEERGRQAFEACVRAGYPLDKITIVVNDKTYGQAVKNEKGETKNNVAGELFKEDQHAYRKLTERAHHMKESLGKLEQQDKAKFNMPDTEKQAKVASVKEAVSAWKEKAATKAAEAAPASQNEAYQSNSPKR